MKENSSPAVAVPIASNRQALLELAERCERESRSYELNYLIFLATNPDWIDTRRRTTRGRLTGDMIAYRDTPRSAVRADSLPNYTESVDAASDLADGFAWTLSMDSHATADVNKWGEISERGEARTPAMALCAAALYARAALLAEPQHGVSP